MYYYASLYKKASKDIGVFPLAIDQGFEAIKTSDLACALKVRWYVSECLL
jgi:hypothetical protein